MADHLVRQSHSWCFRMVVPTDLRQIVGKKELRYSLKTGAVGVAKRKSRFLAGQGQLLFRYLQKGGAALGKLLDEQILPSTEFFVPGS